MVCRTSRLIAVAILMSSALTSVVCAQAEYRFAFVRLKTPGDQSTSTESINELGTAVGTAHIPGAYHAAMWTGGVLVDLGTLGGGNSLARDINSKGWIVGWSGGIGTHRAFLWRDGQMEDIGTLGGDTAEATGISANGLIAGLSKISPGDPATRAFIWENGEMTALDGFAPESSSFAQAINSSGVVVGNGPHPDFSNNQHAAVWVDGQITDLGTFRPDNSGISRAFGINDLGYVVGLASTEREIRGIAFVWHDGHMYNIGKPRGSTASYAYAINNLGQVVGFANNEISGELIAFLWEQGRGMQRLDDLTPPRLRGIGGLKYADDINDAGQIAGTAYPPGDPIGLIGFIMSPVNPTMTLNAPSPGAAGVSNTLSVSNITPGASVTFLYSRFGGGTIIPGCDLQQNALQLDNPTVIGTAIANQQGVATITRPVPLIARGQTILFQALVPGECAISQLVVHRFE